MSKKNAKVMVKKKAAKAMESITRYNRCVMGGVPSSRHFTAEHAEEVNARFFNGGVGRSAAMELVNNWNSVAKRTRYWI
jgi:hypothetical protein